jgi:uncharacterized membrane protein
MKTAERSLTILLWTSILALSVYFFLTNVAVYLTGFRSKVFGDSFFNNQFWVVSHLVGGSLALFFGPIQFWKWIRNRYVTFHRIAGKIYIFGALVAGLSALRLSLISTCVSCRVSLFILAILVLSTTVAAWYSILNKNITSHRQFMIRSYICVFSFVAVRISGILPLTFLFGTISDPIFDRTVNEYFFSFVPLLCGEILMTWVPAIRGTKR